jgi:hypothetical protein
MENGRLESNFELFRVQSVVLEIYVYWVEWTILQSNSVVKLVVGPAVTIKALFQFVLQLFLIVFSGVSPNLPSKVKETSVFFLKAEINGL